MKVSSDVVISIGRRDCDLPWNMVKRRKWVYNGIGCDFPHGGGGYHACGIRGRSICPAFDPRRG